MTIASLPLSDPMVDATSPVQLGHISPVTEQNITISASVKILEAAKDGEDKDKRRLVVKLIEPGLSKNRFYYSKKVAESVADLILERPQMYMDHAFAWFGRSFRDLVAVAVDSYKKKGSAFAVAEMVNNPSTDWLWDLAQTHIEQIAASIDAQAKIRDATAKDGHLWDEEDFDPEIDGTPHTYIVEKIVFLNSVDFVTYGSAGGKVVELMASHVPREAMGKFFKIMEDFEHKVAKLINSKEEGLDMSKDGELTLESLRTNHSDLVTQLQEEFKAQMTEESETTDEISSLKGEVGDLKGKLEEAETANTELRTKVDEFELKERVAVKREKIQQAIADSDLDEEHVSEVFVEDLMRLETDEEIQERIKDRISLVQSENGSVTDNGPRKTKTDPKKGEGDPEYNEEKLVHEIKNPSPTRR